MSIISMTGFGQAKEETDGVQITAEIRSLNHRFLEISCKLPSGYASFEPRLVQTIKQRLERGRVELSVQRRDSRSLVKLSTFKLNEDLFQNFLQIGKKTLQLAGLDDEKYLGRAVLDLLQRREVVEFVPTQLTDTDIENEFPIFERIIRTALDSLSAMRITEGKVLEADLRNHLAMLRELTVQISRKGEGLTSRLQEKFSGRLEKLLSGAVVDSTRLAQEVAILADRLDISEELTRLESHCSQFEQMLGSSGGGRKFEFLIQEMNREVNTLGSKAQDSEISIQVVEAKAVLEKLREQIQNVE